MPLKLPSHALTLALLLSSTATWADDAVIGFVKTVQGDATVVETDQTIKAQPGTPIKISYILKTGQQSSMGITLKDNTLLSIGPDTELAVDEFLYNPAQDALKLGASLSKGTLNYVSGVIAKLKPSAVTVKTPTGNIGVRGTHFVAKVVEE